MVMPPLSLDWCDDVPRIMTQEVVRQVPHVVRQVQERIVEAPQVNVVQPVITEHVTATRQALTWVVWQQPVALACMPCREMPLHHHQRPLVHIPRSQRSAMVVWP